MPVACLIIRHAATPGENIFIFENLMTQIKCTFYARKDLIEALD